ncbi:MAG: pyrroline-5-carboxylate reductase [Dehalococcoidia bacterium]|nr:pyrroline-5-carboxylate reductase [Dehalococcoidia bacterium]
MRITFVGGGTMGGAMIRCLLRQKITAPGDIIVSDVSQSRRELLKRECGVKALANNGEAVESADLIILAVKPQDLAQVMEEIENPAPQQVVLSIVAGASLAALCRGLNHPCIIRAMPNMPAQIGEGMVVWVATAEVNPKQKEMAQSVLGALGEEIYVDDEKYLDMATALSGSGPAYVFLFIEALIDAGVHIGLPHNMAKKLVVQTIIGSTDTVQEMDKHPAELRSMVTSPGGTTSEALLQLERGGFRSLLLEAVAAAYSKAKHL